MRALLVVPVALGALIAGYLWGYGVGERDGLDSDPESEPLCGKPVYLASFDSVPKRYGCDKPKGHTGFHSSDVPWNEPVGELNGG